ncbi:hypothetical protein Zmor_025291 [Zophobas morio]|uniref:3-oxoacyl-[acyl-carrier-protein] synthase n=1 Tax=Zophobas morio TaxID=2755281 RepID=A0AA38HTM2_9CUCU|nr:hypothetical protein Zmor_025291 [Zophobas morio]
MQRRVVVTGIGVISPVGTTVQQAWKTILQGKSGIHKLGKDFETLPCQIAGLIHENGERIHLSNYYTKTELKSMGPATAYALLAAKEAVEDANLQNADAPTKTRTGVAVGMGMVDLDDICKTNDALRKSYKQVSPFFVPRILPNMSAGQISIKYGFQGPNHAVSTACASGAHAIGDSFRFIRHGDADVMVCGAAEACISPLAIAAFCRLRALSTSFNDSPERGSRPFDKLREGFVMGEGSAILVLEELEHAIARKVPIYAEILGYGLSGDASHLTAPHSDGAGAILAMQRAVEDAKIKLGDVGYINAHATSTPVGDAIEIKAIKSLFGGHAGNLAVSSTKGAHGHLLGAAGNLEAVFTVKAVQEGVLPPTVNLETVEEEGVNLVALTQQKWVGTNKRIALKNAFGFGGTNACLCISQFSN